MKSESTIHRDTLKLTSFEEKVKVCERPERFGSVTNCDRSQLDLLWYESSMRILL